MKNLYYAGPDKKPVGPLTEEDVHKLAEDGTISDNTFLITEGQSNWVKYADWKAAQGSAEAAEAIARKAKQMKAAFSKFAFGSFIFGLFMVAVEFFILPWRLFSKAAKTLADWGQSRILPTCQSELAVATFLVIVLRPAVHILYSAIGWMLVIYYSISAMFDRQEPLFFSYMSVHQGSVKDGIAIFVVGSLSVYFTNLAIGAVFDCISIAVHMANSLRNIERK